MSEWYDSQKKPKGDFRKLLQERLDEKKPKLITYMELIKKNQYRQT